VGLHWDAGQLWFGLPLDPICATHHDCSVADHHVLCGDEGIDDSLQLLAAF
jgi:hypothetical protein